MASTKCVKGSIDLLMHLNTASYWYDNLAAIAEFNEEVKFS